MKFYLLLLLALAIFSVARAHAVDLVASNVVTPRIPTYAVQGYEIEGNTVLTPEQIDGVLAGFTGPVLTLARVRQGMVELQSLYRREGCPKAGISLPRQELTHGIIRLIVAENRADLAHIRDNPSVPTIAPIAKTPAPSATNAPAKPTGPTFPVRGYRLYGNTVMPPEKFASVLTNYTGDAITFDRLREGLGELQMLYRNLGFATVGVSLPQQQLTNGYVRVQITEGLLSDITVTGNRHFSSNNVRRALPGLTTNIILNTRWFQPELDRANANADRQIYPVIMPGLEPGTSALQLKVKDRPPLHGHLEINNKSTPDTPTLRIDTAFQHNNLWQREHQLGLQYNFTPQDMKQGDPLPRFWDAPLIASYSAFYRLPLGAGENSRDSFSRQPVDFGYNQVTRTFQMPAPTGRPELTVYASRSDADTVPRLGPVTTITSTALLDITSQFSQRDPSVNGNVGARFAIPLRDFGGVRSSFLAGFDYKDYSTESFSTNFTTVSIYTTNNGPRELFSQRTVALDSHRSVALDYLPLTLGWSGGRPDKWGSTSLSLNQNIYLAGLASDRKSFEIAAVSTNAGGNYTTLNAVLTREQKLPRDWSTVLRAGGQWSSAPLISNEQFALGGTGGVRGYQDGETYGDTGWRVQFDLRAPPINVGYFPDSGGDIPANLRCSWFMDYGQAGYVDRARAETIPQWGAGLGFYLTAGQHFDARLTLGWALLDTPNTSAGEARAYFSVGYQF